MMRPYDEMCRATGEAWADDAFFIFALLVAGRGARGMVPKLEALLAHRTRWPTPRELERPGRMVRRWWKAGLIDGMLRGVGTGQYGRIGGALGWWAATGLDVASGGLTVEELERVPGVGPKSSRFFMLYRRPRVRVAVLDRHILHFLRDCGVRGVPVGTPGKGATYDRLEGEVLRRADALGVGPDVMDDWIWRHFSRGDDVGYDDLMFGLSQLGLAGPLELEN